MALVNCRCRWCSCISFNGCGCIFAIAENTGVPLNATQTLIGPDGTCKVVTNRSPTGRQVYIPASTAEEWQSFIAIPPTGVTRASCEPSIATVGTLPSSIRYSCNPDPQTGKIVCFANNGAATIFVFDPESKALVWKSTVGNTYSGDSCASSRVTKLHYCFGGMKGNLTYSRQIFSYDLANDTRVNKAALLPTGRRLLSCVESTSNDYIYCFGGASNSGETNIYYKDILEYDPITDTLTKETVQLPAARSTEGCAASNNGRIYCIGGSVNGSFVNTIYEYDPVGNAVATKATLPWALDYHSCTASNSGNKVYCLGGVRDSARGAVTKAIFAYNPDTNAVSVQTLTLPSAVAMYPQGCTFTPLTGKIYCFPGGANNEIVEYYPGP